MWKTKIDFRHISTPATTLGTQRTKLLLITASTRASEPPMSAISRQQREPHTAADSVPSSQGCTSLPADAHLNPVFAREQYNIVQGSIIIK
jgi:hypothetical protein